MKRYVFTWLGVTTERRSVAEVVVGGVEVGNCRAIIIAIIVSVGTSLGSIANAARITAVAIVASEELMVQIKDTLQCQIIKEGVQA